MRASPPHPPSAADLSHGFPLVRQPTDDIVLMALTLEKVFLQKVAAMVPKEEEISADVATGRGETSTGPGNEATLRVGQEDLSLGFNGTFFISFPVQNLDFSNSKDIKDPVQ